MKKTSSNLARSTRKCFVKRYLVLGFCIFILGHVGYAQKNALSQITPKSPNVASLDKFIETPVSLATGRIDLSVPLYEFSIGDLKLPISLNYNNNGLKPDEIPSWVGLGWSLFTGGHISYEQKGLNDFDPSRGLFTQKASLDSYFANQMTAIQKQIYFTDIVERNIDSEYDEFYYSLLSGSGSFHFLSPTEARTNPKTDLLISKTAAGFKIVDDKGNTYYFESQEAISSQNTLDITPNFSDNSAYYITKIIASNGETAEFTYKQFYFQYITQSKNLMHSGAVSATCPSVSGVINFDETLYHVYYLLPESIKFPQGKIKFNHSIAFRQDLKLLLGAVGDVPYLSSMEIYNLNNIRIKNYNFNISYFGTNSRLRLDGVEEVSASATSRKWKFEYFGLDFPPFNSSAIDHWGYANNSLVNTTISVPKADYAGMLPGWMNYSPAYFADKSSSFNSSLKGMLKKIVYPTGGHTEFEYESNQFKINKFEEFSFNKFVELPSTSINHSVVYANSWNYNDPASGSFILPYTGYYKVSSFRQASPDPFYQDSEIFIEGNSSTAILLNHKFISNLTNGDEVVYLSAGTYNYKVRGSEYWDNQLYETRYLRAWFQLFGTQFPVTYELGGNRIKKIIHRDHVMNSTIIKKYVYNDFLSNVSFKQIPYYITTLGKYYYPGGEHTFYCLPCQGLDYSIHERSVWPLVGNVIEYGKVTTLTDENGNEGRTDQEFLLSENIAGSTSEPFIAPKNTSWRVGSVQKEMLYDRNQVVKSIDTNKFSATLYGTQINGLKVTPGAICDVGGIMEFRTGLATLFSEKFNISSSENKLYNKAAPIVNATAYTYSSTSHSNPTSITTGNSKAGLKIAKTLYAFDYNNTNNASSPVALGIKWLKNNHINVPIEETEIKEINGVKYITGGTLRVYKSAQAVPEQVYTINLVAPIPESGFVYSSINSSGDFIKDSNYILNVTYSRYDDLNHLLEQSQAKGSPTCYIWGYNGQYPVAEIKNASYAVVESVLNGSLAITNFRNIPDPSASISAFLAPLRTSPNLQNAQITTYTYNPLTGITSMVDPKGIITRYEYDAFQRLKNIKDHEGNIVKSYSYNYGSPSN